MEDRVWVGGPATNDKGKECGWVEVGLRIEVEVNEKFRVNEGIGTYRLLRERWRGRGGKLAEDGE